MQPTYLPWSGYFALMQEVETFVFLDDVQLSKGSWQHKNRIKAIHGERVLNLTLDWKNSPSKHINDVVIKNDVEGVRKHLELIKLDYKKASYFDEFYPVLENAMNVTSKIGELNISIIKAIASYLNIPVRFELSSMIPTKYSRTHRLIEILKALGSSDYLSPVGSFYYIDEDNLFSKHGIDLVYQNYTPAIYEQLYQGFISNLSVIDLIFNYGKESAEIIMKGIHSAYSHEELAQKLAND